MLVDYSDSESDSQQEQEKSSKRRKLEGAGSRAPPPLPASFHSLYATNVRTATADDPSLHAGRSRQVPHIEGNWPTHVYLEWLPSKDSLGEIQDIITRLQNLSSEQSSIYSFLRSDLDVQQPLHISLTALLVVRTEQKDGFRDALLEAIETSGARTFRVYPTTLAWVPNLEGSRYFLVLKLTRPSNDDLNKLLTACNACARAWGMTLLYSDGAPHKSADSDLQSLELDQDRSCSFHISVAWTLEKPSDAQQAAVGAEAGEQLCTTGIEFSSVKIKIGNSVSDVDLAP